MPKWRITLLVHDEDNLRALLRELVLEIESEDPLKALGEALETELTEGEFEHYSLPMAELKSMERVKEDTTCSS